MFYKHDFHELTFQHPAEKKNYSEFDTVDILIQFIPGMTFYKFCLKNLYDQYKICQKMEIFVKKTSIRNRISHKFVYTNPPPFHGIKWKFQKWCLNINCKMCSEFLNTCPMLDKNITLLILFCRTTT